MRPSGRRENPEQGSKAFRVTSERRGHLKACFTLAQNGVDPFEVRWNPAWRCAAGHPRVGQVVAGRV